MGDECQDVGEEIHADDKDDASDLLAAMVQEAEDDEEQAEKIDCAEEAATGVLEEDEKVEKESKEDNKRPYIVDLWPFSRSVGHYATMVEELGYGGPDQLCLILTSTAHPGSALAALRLQMKPIVFSGRLKTHSLNHGKIIAKHVLLTEEFLTADVKERVAKRKFEVDVHTIQGPHVPREDQALETFDVPAGEQWFDGMNKQFTGDDLETLVPRLVAREVADLPVSTTAPRERL